MAIRWFGQTNVPIKHPFICATKHGHDAIVSVSPLKSTQFEYVTNAIDVHGFQFSFVTNLLYTDSVIDSIGGFKHSAIDSYHFKWKQECNSTETELTLNKDSLKVEKRQKEHG